MDCCYRSHMIILAALAALSSLVVFYRLGAADMYHIRLESRRAEIARNMLESGDWIVPRIAGEPILTKPPIYFWAAAACSLKTGMNEFTARAPSAAAAVGTVLMTYLLGILLFNRASGLCAALVLLTTNIFLFEARYAELESLLTFFITAAVYFFFRGYRDPSRARRWFALFFAMMGLGTMTKGPFAFTFPMIPMLLYLFMYKEQRLLAAGRFRSGLWWFFALVLPWVVLVTLQHPKFIGILIWETVFYYTKGEGGHREPFFYYFAALPGVFFPWILFLPLLLWAAFTERLKFYRKEILFLVLWVAGNFVFLTCSKSKRDFYLTPIAPAIALLAGAAWGPMCGLVREKLRLRMPLVVRILFFMGAACAGIAMILPGHTLLNLPGKEFPRIPEFLLFTGLTMLAAAMVKGLRQRLAFSRISCGAVVVVFLLFHWFHATYTIPIRNSEESPKWFYVFVAKTVAPAAPLAWFGRIENFAFSFNAHRPVTYVHTADEATRYMASPEQRYMLIQGKDIEEEFESMPWRRVMEHSYSKQHPLRKFVLVSNH